VIICRRTVFQQAPQMVEAGAESGIVVALHRRDDAHPR
jgi:hypothetical protein